MKKIVALFLCVALVVSLAACGSKKDPEPTKPSSDITEHISITWWHTMDSQYDSLVNELVDKFNSSQEYITVVPEYMGSFSDINEALVAANAAGEGLPGVAVCNTKFIASYANNGLFEDLTPYIENTAFDVSNMEPGMYEIGSFGNKQIAMPFFHNTHVIYYNKDMAEKYNLTIPTEFSELGDFFKSVKEKTGVTPLSMQSLDFYYGSFYRNAGVKIIDGDKSDLNSDTAIDITTQLQSWVKNGYISWLEGNDASSNMKQSFYQGNSFAVLHNSTALEAHQESANFNVGVAWYPGVNGMNNADLGGGVIGIPAKNSDEVKNAAWQFISYLCGNDTTMKIATDTGYLPICKDALTKDSTSTYLEKFPEYKTVFDNLNKVTPPIIDESASELCKIWQQYMNMIMLENADVSISLNNAVTEINEVLAD